MRSYEVLVQWSRFSKIFGDQGDAESLEILYKNVSFYFCAYLDVSATIFSSYARELTWRGETTQAISRLLFVTWVVDMYGASDPPLRARSKDERGFANEHTGRLLCPSEFSWDDPE